MVRHFNTTSASHRWPRRGYISLLCLSRISSTSFGWRETSAVHCPNPPCPFTALTHSDRNSRFVCWASRCVDVTTFQGNLPEHRMGHRMLMGGWACPLGRQTIPSVHRALVSSCWRIPGYRNRIDLRRGLPDRSHRRLGTFPQCRKPGWLLETNPVWLALDRCSPHETQAERLGSHLRVTLVAAGAIANTNL